MIFQNWVRRCPPGNSLLSEPCHEWISGYVRPAYHCNDIRPWPPGNTVTQYLEVFKNEDINQDQRQIPSDPLNPDAGKGEFRVHTFAAGGGSDIIVIKSNSSELTVADSQYKKFVEDFFLQSGRPGTQCDMERYVLLCPQATNR